MRYRDINNNAPSNKVNIVKKDTKKNGNVRMIFSIFTLLIIFLFVLTMPKSTKAYSEGKYQNYFYLKVINNTVSVFNSSETEEVYISSVNDMKFAVLSFLGIDIMNPISIITKEIAFLNESENNTYVDNTKNEEVNLKTVNINPFKLEEKQISKTDVKDNGTNTVLNLDNPDLKKTLNKAKPEVFIYHSHTSEAYRTSDKDTTSVNSNLDQTKNVVSVGDVIAEELEKKYGIAVIHDKTVHDKDYYPAAYQKSGVTLDKYLKVYGDFKLIIDLHRDSVDKSRVTTEINGESVAKYMFVVTTKNPRYPKQKKLIDSMIGISNKLFPSLLRSTPIHPYQYGMGFYNQNRSDNAVLLEVGSNNNTIQEVRNTGVYLARIIAEQINGKSE
ncbi:stage II sporulation protein P [Clostridium sp.]|uniref:stage II sporulation protein P n=1 Tax=Clostridium sp. TaxID=1506 RepID=UPI001A38F7DC|nr:stage II sporulation protein P [Clostridium sp.]MBK5242608.1 stage II sporulation protein P [Clostridium sp.]